MENNFNTQPYTPFVPYGFTPETYAERKDIRRRAIILGIPAICLFAISYVWSYVYFFVTSNILKIDVGEAYKIAQNPAVQQILQVVLSTLMFTLPFVISVRAAGLRVGELVDFDKPKKDTALPMFLLGVGFCAFANISVSYASGFFRSFGFEYNVDYGDSPKGIFGFILSIIATAAIPALVEEFACRGIMIGLLKKYGQGFAVITSSLLFGVMHGNFDQIPFAVLVGLILGFIYVKTGSVWVCVAVHAANNLVSVIFNYMPSSLSENAKNVIYLVYLAVCMLLAIVGVLMLHRHGKQIYSFENADNHCTQKQKYKWFFTSAVIIVFVVLNIIEACTYFVL